MGDLSLLLSPAISRNGQGLVTPTVSGVTTTIGQYQTAWNMGTGGTITIPVGSYLNNVEGSVLVRFRAPITGYTCIWQADGVDGSARVFFGIDNSESKIDQYFGTYYNQWTPEAVTANVWHVLAVTWDGGQLKTFLDGVLFNAGQSVPYVLTPGLSNNITLGSPQYSRNMLIEQALFYDSFLSDGQVASLSAQTSPWVWPKVDIARYMDVGKSNNIGPMKIGRLL